MSALPAQLDSPDAAATNAAMVVNAAGLGKRIDERSILSGINLEVAAGRFVGLLGANGAGKSTLLKILATLMPSSEGELKLFGRSVSRDCPAVRSRIGLIGHQTMLYRDLTARENLEFFGRLYGVPDPRGRAELLLEAVDLIDRADDAVKSYSRGMAQRLAIARALVHKPDLLLADEPFDGLDAPSARSLEGILGQLHEAGKTIVLVNHDIEQSLRIVERAVVLRRGRIVIDRPAKELDAAAVLGEMEHG